MKILKIIAAFFLGVLIVALFTAWCSWGSYPGNWLVESRFFVGGAAIGLGVLLAMMTADNT